MAKYRVETDQGTFEVETDDPSRDISGFVKEHLSPISFPVIRGLEDVGHRVKDVAEKSFGNIVDRPLPEMGDFNLPVAAGRFMASKIGKTAIQAAPFTPSEFSIAAGAELAPVALTPNKIAPKLGKSYLENSIPSSSGEIRHATKYGEKTAAELVLERPRLGNSRDEILENSKKGISEIEKQVQKKLDQTINAGKIDKGTLPITPSYAEKIGIKGGTLPTIELPGSGKVPRFGEFPEGSGAAGSTARGGQGGTRWLEPGEHLMTKGRPFKKANAKGVFEPGETNIISKQTGYLKEEVQSTLQRIKDDFIERASAPEYMGLRKGFAIGKDEIASAFDDVAGGMKTGTEKNSLDALQELKGEFLDSHPKYADVQYWNDVKRAIYKLVGDKGYLTQTPSAKVQVLKAIANNIKRKIGKIVPGLDDLSAEQGALLDIRDSIIQSSPKEVRDARLFGPVFERVTIRGAKVLAKPRKAPVGGVGLSLPVISTNNENGY
jgi:hypothetical protein